MAAIALAATAMLGTLPPPAASPLARAARHQRLRHRFRQVGASRPDDRIGSARRQPLHRPCRRLRLENARCRASAREPAVHAARRPRRRDRRRSTLTPGREDSYVGSGANLAFDGRWRVNVLIERAGDSVEVPLEVETRIKPRWVSRQHASGSGPDLHGRDDEPGSHRVLRRSRARRSQQGVRGLVRLHRRPAAHRLDGRYRCHCWSGASTAGTRVSSGAGSSPTSSSNPARTRSPRSRRTIDGRASARKNCHRRATLRFPVDFVVLCVSDSSRNSPQPRLVRSGEGFALPYPRVRAAA